jgi:hypothetical protein
MPITIFLDGYKPDPETIRVMGVAFEMVRAALRLNDRNDVAVEIIAKRIIDLARGASAIQTSFASGHCAIFARRRRRRCNGSVGGLVSPIYESTRREK